MSQSVSGCQAVAKAKKSVAVVGAGAAGLAVAATLRRSCLVTVFERSSDFVGGVWNYSSDRNGGPMYCRLRTNLPKEIMAYPDWEWRRPAGVSFVDHDSVLEYLRSYCYDQDKVVALLGAASSGQDIALELTSSAEHVYLCHRGPRLQSALPKNLTELYAMDSVSFDANNNQFHIFVSTDDSSSAIGKVQVDHVMFCTGYDYNFPFLASELTRPSHVPNLYMQVAHCTLPGLFFVGLCTHVVPFPQFHLQSKLIEAILLGQLQLPDDAESTSLRDEAEKLASGVPARHLHLLGDDQWDYNDQLADLAGCQRLPVVMRLIYDDVRLERKLRLVDFRQWAYSITGPDSFEKRFVS
uniref:Flavin-containing monooxygenase n=1 Tax=Macrostomum lignano TaxID=282301 RepID=A0A1I8J0M9_9PLAT